MGCIGIGTLNILLPTTPALENSAIYHPHTPTFYPSSESLA